MNPPKTRALKSGNSGILPVFKVNQIFKYLTCINIVLLYHDSNCCMYHVLPDSTSLYWVQLGAFLALEVFGKVWQIGLWQICPPVIWEVAILLGVTSNMDNLGQIIFFPFSSSLTYFYQTLNL